MKHLKVLTALAIGTALLLSACAPAAEAPATEPATEAPAQSSGEAEQPATESEGNHLNFGCANFAEGIDPITSISASWNGVRFGVTECLFRFDG